MDAWRDIQADLAAASAEQWPDHDPGLDLLARLARNRPSWMRDALCAECSEVTFFPDVGQTATTAKAVCARCLVCAECLAYAIDNGEAGVWGGTTDRERCAMRVGRAA